jgi:hypothetical protein
MVRRRFVLRYTGVPEEIVSVVDRACSDESSSVAG